MSCGTAGSSTTSGGTELARDWCRVWARSEQVTVQHVAIHGLSAVRPHNLASWRLKEWCEHLVLTLMVTGSGTSRPWRRWHRLRVCCVTVSWGMPRVTPLSTSRHRCMHKWRAHLKLAGGWSSLSRCFCRLLCCISKPKWCESALLTLTLTISSNRCIDRSSQFCFDT